MRKREILAKDLIRALTALAVSVLTILRALILQDYLWALRRTKIVPRFTIVKSIEECLVISVVASFIIFLGDTTLEKLFLHAMIIHVSYAFLSPAIYNALKVKKRIRPIPRHEIMPVLIEMIKDIKRYTKSIIYTGSICYSDLMSDVDITFIPNSYFSAYFLFLYSRLWILKFLFKRISFFPDFYIHDVNFYDYYCDLNLV